MSEQLSDDLRTTIENAANGMDWGEGGSDASTNQAGPSGETETSEGRARDEAGRFARKEGDAAAQTEAPPPEDDYEDGLGFERDAWGRLPQDLRPQVKTLAQQRREAEARAKGYEPFDAALAPVRDAWTVAYGSPDQALKQLIAIERVARENPTEFLRQFVQQRGINVAELFGQAQGAQTQQRDPMQILRDETRAVLQQEMQQREVASALQSFEADTSLEHRQNPAVRSVMAGLLHSGAAQDIRAAYEMAIHADPTIRAKLSADQAAAQAKQERERAAQAASERQSAAVSTTGGPGTTRAPASDAASDNSIEAVARRAWDAQVAGRI